MALYGKDLSPQTNLLSLLNEILGREELTRLRLSSLEPYSVDKKLIELFRHNKMCQHIHLPFQSGDNRILKEMNKKENIEMYEQIAKDLRKINPGIAISCDIIVDLPKEDETSFNNTVKFLKRIAPMRTHIFTFSPREKTRFYGTKINTEKIKKRFAQLKNITDYLALEYKKSFLGKTLNVIAEEARSGYICGYSENYLKIHVKSQAQPGEMLKVRIDRIDNDKIFGVA